MNRFSEFGFAVVDAQAHVLTSIENVRRETKSDPNETNLSKCISVYLWNGTGRCCRASAMEIIQYRKY